MAKKKTTAGDDRMVAVEEALGKTEQFVEKNQKILMYVVMGIILVVLVYFGYQRFYVSPMEENAQEQIFMAQKYFEMDSLNRALYGDGNALGFLDIIDDYGSTRAGNLAKYYAGIAYLKMGNYEEAIEFLKDHDPVDQMVGPMALGGIGDAYMELNEPEKAVDYYLDAADVSVNDFTTPMYLYRAGIVYEMLGDYDEAYDAYERIFKEFNRSPEGRSIERDLAKVKALMEQDN
jgi:tetratricopeptide (TPR) repeat protein